MSLDDLIKKKQDNPKKGGAKKSGPVRGGKNKRQGRAQARNTPYANKKNDGDVDMKDGPKKSGARSRRGKGGKPSILSRLGDQPKKAPTGHKIFIKNMSYDILEKDVREMLQTIGKVTEVEMLFDRSGRSTGNARAWMARRGDAEKAVANFDGRTLDGKPMKVILDDSKDSGRARNDAPSNKSQVFGSALRRGDRGDRGESRRDNRPRGRGQRRGSQRENNGNAMSDN